MFFKIIITTLLALILGACAGSHSPVKPNEKAFVEEDAYILFALRAEQLKDYGNASIIFNTLWEKSEKREYLYKSLQNDIANTEYKKVVKKVDEVIESKLDDFILIRLKIIALLGEEKFEDARVLAIKLVDISKKPTDYIMVSDIYVKQKKFDTALKYLESAYSKEYNENILDRMSIILYVNLQRKKDAIAQLETHLRLHGCSKKVCDRLLGFYSNENNIDGLLSIYLRKYSLHKSSEIANKIVQIYLYKKEHLKLLIFLKDSGSDDDLLLQLYINSKNYEKAYLLAEKLYEEKGDINYLGQSAIFEYENAKNKNNKKMQRSVIKKLSKVVKIDKNALYLNYLGYLLIDHSIDIKKGMIYVREALNIEPQSAFYLDSLAWGYYKLGKCKKALRVIKKVIKLEGGDDPEVLAHFKAIKKCKNKKTKGKKKR
ncbi:hypothetical protein [Sulfurimonas sp.]|uniref:tetratricopeptide repeat protein n=1 Tax=Sulfurimonas sp. TaxID=2022749 RepID=UPI002AAFCAEC|nr:hypothetical protein [Sulfurimonas sp.]